MRRKNIKERKTLFYLVESTQKADPCYRTVKSVGLRPLACWDYGFKSRRGYGCLSLVSVVCCQVEVSATG